MDFADKVRSYESMYTALALKDFQRNLRTRRSAPSGGRVESEFQGLSDMDVARASSGQGWPVDAGP